jgi:hypothetical protein
MRALLVSAGAGAGLALMLLAVAVQPPRPMDALMARVQSLDLVTKMNGYSPNGVSYSEGQMPLGLGAASGICDHGYCPQESEEVEVNPREVPTSQFAVRWTGFNWDSMDDDINVFQPSPCLSQHLADLPVDKCCESGLEPCDGWGQGTIEAVRGASSLRAGGDGGVDAGIAPVPEGADLDVWGLPISD